MDSHAAPKTSDAVEAKESPLEDDNDDLTAADYYADSYAHFGIHEEMLKDAVRTKTYIDAITKNKHLFKGKVVLDVGCGTGILSMVAAKAGAKKVVGVDMSAIAESATKIVEANGLSDVISIIRGKIEEVDIGVEHVDVIVSEWMGYFLLYESMMDSVLFARDKWLVKENGVLFPDIAEMYIVGIEDGAYKEEKISWWENVYGFDMSVMKEEAMKEPLVEDVEADAVCTEPSLLARFDLNTVSVEDLDFSTTFKLLANRTDYVHAFTVYFDVVFSKTHTQIGFTTSPDSEPTHWKQTSFYLQEELLVKQNEVVNGVLRVEKSTNNHRDLDVWLSYDASRTEMSGGVVRVCDGYKIR